jgi:hypothetical protein
VRGALLVPHQDVLNIVPVIVKRVVHRHNRATWIAEDRIDPFSFQQLK